MRRSEDGPDPVAWIERVADARRRDEARLLLPWFERTTGLPARLWNDRLVGFGRYRYRHASGRTGECWMTGFAPTKAAISVHVMPGYRDLGEPLARLGPHRLGKSCLYLPRLEAVDLAALADIVTEGLAHLRDTHETFDA